VNRKHPLHLIHLIQFNQRNLYIFSVLLCAITVGLTLGKVSAGDFNNYLIFKFSFSHLWNNQSLYQLYPQEHQDLFKYGPSFALAMFPFQFFPLWFGAIVWNLLNTILFLAGIHSLNFTAREKYLILLFTLPEWIGNLQNFQSNTLLTGLFLLGFASMGTNRWVLAGFFMAISVHIKIFGLAMAALAFLFPHKRKILISTLLWTFGIALVPSIFIGWENLIQHYNQWIGLLKWDHARSDSQGLSIMSVVKALFGVHLHNTTTQLLGALISGIPILYGTFNGQKSKHLYLVSILLWMIVFNHKSESPTFIIGLTAIAVWYVQSSLKYKEIIIAGVLFCTSVTSSDLFTTSFKNDYFVPYELKVWPLIVCWIALQFHFAKTKMYLRS
jgi:Glycosyltransferase family 87